MDIPKVTLEEELQKGYLDYAMSVIIGRAIPDARDGMKPVQRRILYTMYTMKNFHNLPTKKSAKVVGQVMGNYHPHGDSAIYEAMARLAQDFSTNYLLVEGQGNFGSIDGDPPAAMRYTEVRMTKLSENILDDIEKDTVDTMPNFDNTETEPIVLPGKVPNLLLNGATGIAVGVATSILPNNLIEVCDAIVHSLTATEVTTDSVMSIIKGPDFPTGGIAVMSQGAYSGYKNGRGQVTVKAKYEIDGKKKKVIFTEIPYAVNKSTLIQTMARLAREKVITGIKDIRDETAKEGIRVVVDYKDEFSAEQIVNSLFMHTQLQTTVPIINLAIVGKTLKNMTVLDMINTFVIHRHEVILRRSKFELKTAQDKLHIVEGLLVAISDIENVIKLIKSSDSSQKAREQLSLKYKLSEKQSTAILDMRLGRLTHLENESLENDKKELTQKSVYYQGVIDDPQKINQLIIDETTEVKKLYGRPRKTEIVYSEEADDIEEEDMISDEKVTIIFTESGYMKRMSESGYKEQDRGGKGLITINLKEGDYVKQVLTCNNKDYIICITNKGRAYWLKAYKVPSGTRYAEGKSVVNLLDIKDEKVVVLLHIKDFEKSEIVMLTRKGTTKKMKGTLFSRPRSNGIIAMTISEDDEIIDAKTYSTEKYIIITTKNGKAIKYSDSDIREIGRTGMGVRGIRLHEKDVALDVIPSGEHGSVLTITEKGYGKITEVSKYRLQHRGGSGVINIKVNEKTGNVAKSLFITNETKVILINSKGVSITFPIGSIRVTGRAARGVRLMKLDPGAIVKDATLITEIHPTTIPQN